MSRAEFLKNLENKLYNCPQSEIEKSISYYSEIIDDRMEEGATEEEAVNSLGNLDDIANEIKSGIPMKDIVKARVNRKSLDTFGIVMLVITAPVWMTLLFAAVVVAFSLYISIWAVVIALWAVVVAFGVSALACIAATVIVFINQDFGAGMVCIGTGFIMAGLTILSYMLLILLTKGVVLLTTNVIKSIKVAIIGNKEAE